MKQFLLLVAVIAVVFGALLVSLWVLDLIKLAELQNDLRIIFGVLGVAAVAGVLILSHRTGRPELLSRESLQNEKHTRPAHPATSRSAPHPVARQRRESVRRSRRGKDRPCGPGQRRQPGPLWGKLQMSDSLLLD